MADTVIIGTDGSAQAAAAMAAAAALIDLTGRDVIVASVVEESDPTLVTGAGFAGPVLSQEEYDADRAKVMADAEAATGDAAATLTAVAGSVTTRITWGDPGPALAALADETGAGLIVVGTRGRGGLVRAVLGSVADHLVRRAPCPVLIVGSGPVTVGDGPVLAAVDDSDQAEGVVRTATRWFGDRHAVSVVTVVDEVEEFVPYDGSAAHHSLLGDDARAARDADQADEAGTLISDIIGRAGDQRATAGPVLTGDPVPAILSLAESSDAAAIVVGTRGRGGLGRALLGSVADQVIRGSSRPVLVTRAQPPTS